MPLPHDTLVLVADGRKMLLLRNHGDKVHLDLRIEEHDEQTLPKDSDIKSDLAGQSPAPGGTGLPGGTMGEVDYQQQAEDRWAADTASLINRRALRNKLEHLAVIAPAKTMGALRKHWHKEVERRVVMELTKEMTDRPIPDIEAALVGNGSPPSGGN
ncbi:MAG: host attachment family protein [Sphingorhabdus sp.]